MQSSSLPSFLITAVASLIFASAGVAQTKTLNNLDASGLAVQGYDVVSYFADGKALKGSPQLTSKHQGGTYQFASPEHKAAFEKSPEKYAPRFGGFCAYAVSKNTTAKIEPDAFQIVDGKLLLQYNQDILKKFSKDATGNLARAEANWPGLVEKKGK